MGVGGGGGEGGLQGFGVVRGRGLKRFRIFAGASDLLEIGVEECFSVCRHSGRSHSIWSSMFSSRR